VAKGCRVVGIELDAAAAALARPYCEEVIVGSVEAKSVVERAAEFGPFGNILLGDVLEHLVDPRPTMQRLTRLLVVGGSVIISVPNVAYLGMRLRLLLGRFEYSSTGLLDMTHLRFFTVRSIVDLVRAAGLTPSLITATPPILGTGRAKYFPVGSIAIGAANEAFALLARARPELFGYQIVVKARKDSVV
jgi:hypothetical protein